MSDWDEIPGPEDDYDPIVDGYESAEQPPPAPPEDGGEGLGPDGCPVVPIGTHRNRFYYVTALGELTWLAPKDHASDMMILALFGGREGWLWKRFPATRRQGEDEIQYGWHAKRAGTWLMQRCAELGLVDVAAELRGVGAWVHEAGEEGAGGDGRRGVAFHAGDAVLVPDGKGGGQWRRPGRYGRHLYGADRRIDRPGPVPLSTGQAAQLLALLQRWPIRGPKVNFRLLLGFIAAACLPGTLDWRPSVWLIGAKETGKTTLQRLIADLLGSTGVLVANTSEPAIRHALGVHALTVMVDEFETSNLGPVVEQVLDLVRVASSGRSGKVMRGGANGQPVFTTLVASFVFSSIHAPQLSSADRSRLTVLEFGQLDGTTASLAAFEAARDAVAGFGPALRRRCLDAWPRFSRALATVQAALAAQGHGNRARDQLGTLLAWSHLLLSDDDMLADEADDLVADLDAAAMAEEADDLEEHDQWLLHLLASRCPDWQSGERRPIGRLIMDAVAPVDGDRSREELANLGLAVVPAADERRPYGPWLLVSNTSPDIARIFAGTRWEKVRWRDLLLRAPAAEVAGQTRFHAGFSSKAVAVHMATLPLGDRFWRAPG